LIVLPANNSPGNIRILGSLVAPTEQQYNRLPCLRVVNSVAYTNIDPQLPHTISTKAMIGKVPQSKTIDTALNGNTRSHVTQTIKPVLKQVVTLRG